MNTNKEKRQFYTCNQCGYEWFKRRNAGPKSPESCPSCRSRLWDKPSKRNASQ